MIKSASWTPYPEFNSPAVPLYGYFVVFWGIKGIRVIKGIRRRIRWLRQIRVIGRSGLGILGGLEGFDRSGWGSCGFGSSKFELEPWLGFKLCSRFEFKSRLGA